MSREPWFAAHPRRLENAALHLAAVAQDVDDNIMSNGLAQRRQRLRDAIAHVELLVRESRAGRAADNQEGSE